MKPDPEKYRELARFLLATRPDEIGCDEWLAQIGEYADTVLAGRPIPVALAEVQRHMETCPECAEEFRAILAALCDEA
jgi:hypothetical protein